MALEETPDCSATARNSLFVFTSFNPPEASLKPLYSLFTKGYKGLAHPATKARASSGYQLVASLQDGEEILNPPYSLPLTGRKRQSDSYHQILNTPKSSNHGFRRDTTKRNTTVRRSVFKVLAPIVPKFAET
jgi:hypothetical protein